MQGDRVCIGGHDLDDRFRSIRLLDPFGHAWSDDVPFAVGQVWDVTYWKKASAQPPHVEDVYVKDYRPVARARDFPATDIPTRDLKALVLKHRSPWTGGPSEVFEGTIRSTKSGTAYIPGKGRLPRCSTGYWVPEQALERHTFGSRVRFTLPDGQPRRFAWVGAADPPERIDAGSLVRVSLSRLFKSETAPEGYYVQISGVI